MKRATGIGSCLVALLLAGCAGGATPPAAVPDLTTARKEVNHALDAWHRAAAEADVDEYWDRLEADAVFIGTDARERWDRAEFERLYRKHFEAGKAWTFVPRDRHIYFSADGTLAYFDEVLDTEKLGELRGSGVARRTAGTWYIAHYVLSVPVPNALLPDLVKDIAAYEAKEAVAEEEPSDDAGGPATPAAPPPKAPPTITRGSAPSAPAALAWLKPHVPASHIVAEVSLPGERVAPYAPRRVRIGDVAGWLLLTQSRDEGFFGAVWLPDGSTVALPVPVPERALCRIGGVFQGNGDADAALETAVVVELMPGIGPEAARCAPHVLIIDGPSGSTRLDVTEAALRGASLRIRFGFELRDVLP